MTEKTTHASAIPTSSTSAIPTSTTMALLTEAASGTPTQATTSARPTSMASAYRTYTPPTGPAFLAATTRTSFSDPTRTNRGTPSTLNIAEPTVAAIGPVGQPDVSILLQTLIAQMSENAKGTNERLDDLATAQQICHSRINDLHSPGNRGQTPRHTTSNPRLQRVLFGDLVAGPEDRAGRSPPSSDQNGIDQRRSTNDDPQRWEHAYIQPATMNDAYRPDHHNSELETIKRQLKLMTSRVHQATSSAPEIDRVLKEAQNTPFTSSIINSPARHPGKIKVIAYNGTTDPMLFMTAFSVAMCRTQFTPEERDAGYCQLFVENLTGAALSWFSKLQANSIDSYHDLSMAFLKHYSMYIEQGACEADLYTLRQGQKESLRSYINKFKCIVSKVSISDDAAIPALRNGLWYESIFYEEMKKNKPQTLEDALHRATTFIELEEEKIEKTKKYGNQKASTPKEKPKEDYYEPRQHIDNNYQRNDRGNRPSTFAVSDAHFKQQQNGRSNKYIRPNQTDSSETPKPYCDFHKRYGHTTEECRHLHDHMMARYKRELKEGNQGWSSQSYEQRNHPQPKNEGERFRLAQEARQQTLYAPPPTQLAGPIAEDLTPPPNVNVPTQKQMVHRHRHVEE